MPKAQYRGHLVTLKYDGEHPDGVASVRKCHHVLRTRRVADMDICQCVYCGSNINEVEESWYHRIDLLERKLEATGHGLGHTIEEEDFQTWLHENDRCILAPRRDIWNEPHRNLTEPENKSLQETLQGVRDLYERTERDDKAISKVFPKIIDLLGRLIEKT